MAKEGTLETVTSWQAAAKFPFARQSARAVLSRHFLNTYYMLNSGGSKRRW